MLFDGVKSTRSQCVVPKWSGSMRRCCAKHRRVGVANAGVGVALECFISPGKFDEIRFDIYVDLVSNRDIHGHVIADMF